MRSTPAVTTRRREWRIAGEARHLVAELQHGAAVDEAGGVGVGRAHPVDEDRARIRDGLGAPSAG